MWTIRELGRDLLGDVVGVVGGERAGADLQDWRTPASAPAR
jgi:hypothetical protein